MSENQYLGKADWYPDPTGRNQFRYWDGESWLNKVSNNETESDDFTDYDDGLNVNWKHESIFTNTAFRPFYRQELDIFINIAKEISAGRDHKALVKDIDNFDYAPIEFVRNFDDQNVLLFDLIPKLKTWGNEFRIYDSDANQIGYSHISEYIDDRKSDFGFSASNYFDVFNMKHELLFRVERRESMFRWKRYVRVFNPVGELLIHTKPNIFSFTRKAKIKSSNLPPCTGAPIFQKRFLNQITDAEGRLVGHGCIMSFEKYKRKQSFMANRIQPVVFVGNIDRNQDFAQILATAVFSLDLMSKVWLYNNPGVYSFENDPKMQLLNFFDPF